MELLIGCGKARDRRYMVRWDGKELSPCEPEWIELKTLDANPSCNPDVVWDLHNIPLPFEDNTFDEIHAYEILEHTGAQGDHRFFFKQFEEFHRILKPNGCLYATTPSWQSRWAWGDPSHTRVINDGTLTFLSQEEYQNVGKTTMSDYRDIYHADFKMLSVGYSDETFCFIIQAVK